MFISALSAPACVMADEEAAAEGGGEKGAAAAAGQSTSMGGEKSAPTPAAEMVAPAATTGKRSRGDVLREGPSRDDVRGCGLFLDPLRKELAATRRPLR